MSHEILAVVGPDDSAAAQRRRLLVEHATGLVPGAVQSEFYESRHTMLAVVRGHVTHGTLARVECDADRLRVALALTEQGLDRAWSASEPWALGAEAGHVQLSEHDGEVRLSGDGAAFFPGFWANRGENLLVSTHLASMVSLGVPADVDEQAALDYLTHSHPLRRRTLLAGVSVLGQGGIVTWSAQGCHVEERALYDGPGESMTDAEAVIEFRGVWQAILADLEERSSAHRSIVGLSGGLDSRAIVGGMVAAGRLPMTYTYGSSHIEETQAAREVAETLSLPQLIIPVTSQRVLRDPLGTLDLLDGAHSPGQMYELWFDDVVREAAEVVVNGLPADTLWGDDKAMGMTGQPAVAAQLERWVWGDASAAAEFVAPGAGDVAAMVRSSLVESMGGWDFDGRSDTVVFWNQSNKNVRWGSMLTNVRRRRGLTLEAPFLDSRFLGFSRRLTPPQRLNGQLYLRIHRELFADVAHIKRGDDGNPPAALNHAYWSGDRSIRKQMVDIARSHPLSALRRGARRAGDLAAWRTAGTPLRAGGQRWQQWRSVFPSRLWVESSQPYRNRLADLLDAAQGAHTILNDDALGAQAAGLRRGQPVASPLVAARVGALGSWVNDYRRRAGLLAALA